jgi:mycothiol system anti-sigma-R factor
MPGCFRGPKRRLTSMTEPDPISCEEVIAHLLEYLDGEIDANKRAQIDRHLEHCRGCYSRAEFEKALKSKVSQLGEASVSDTLRKRIKSLLDSF